MLYVQKWCPDYICWKILKRSGLWTPTKNLALFLQICHTLSCWIRLCGMASQSNHCTERLTGGSLKTCSICTSWQYHTILYSLSIRLSLFNCDNTVLNRFTILHDLLLPERELSVPLWLWHSTLIYSLPHRSGPHKTVLFLHKLLPKVLGVMTIYVCNSAILFYCIVFMCCTLWYLFLCNLHLY